MEIELNGWILEYLRCQIIKYSGALHGSEEEEGVMDDSSILTYG